MVGLASGEDTGGVRRSVLLVTVAAALVACGPSTPTPTPTPSPQSTSVRLFWAADTGTAIRLFREDGVMAVSSESGLSALRALLGSRPTDPDYSSLWPADAKVRSVRIEGSEATVDLAPVRLSVGAEAEWIAIQQLLWTLLAAEPTLRSMRLTVDGSAIESLAGHVDATQPFTRPPAYEVVALVWMLEPRQGSMLDRDAVTLRGMACTFEANVAWSIRRGTTIVRSGSTTAAAACPEWSPWSVTVQGLAPGDYVAEAAEYSAKDGSLVVRDTKAFTLR